jgi:hypothetical protein
MDPEELPTYRAEREIARTLADRIMRNWLREDRSPAVMGLTIVRLHALLLAAAPAHAREDGITRYIEALRSMIGDIACNGP